MTFSIPRAALAALIFVGAPLAAQSSTADKATIEKSVATYLRTVITDRPLAFDGSTRGIGDTRPAQSRAQEHVSALAQLLGASEMNLDSAIQCGQPKTPSTCRLVNATAIVRIGEPVIVGDSAKVKFYSRRMTSEGRQPVKARDGEILLVRSQGQWRVIGIGKTRIT